MPDHHDPLRTQKLSLLAGCVLAGAALVLGAIPDWPGHSGIPDDAVLVMSRQSGALFVRQDGHFRAVANLTSARLLLGSPATPRLVDETALREVATGPVLGIPAAPASLGQVIAPREMRWAVCDDAGGSTTVSVGDDAVPAELDPHTAVVAAVAHGDGSTYLLYDGKRALLDPGEPAVARALRLDGVAVRKLSPLVLNAIPEAPAITAPRIAGMDRPSAVTGFPIGTVLRVARTDSPEYYVALPGGVQRVGRLAAELIRFAAPAAGPEITAAPPELIARLPLVDDLLVAAYPDQPPQLLAADAELCATWLSGSSGVAVGGPADRPGSVRLAGADGDGPAVDNVRMPPGCSLDVTDAPASARYLVSDAGIRYPVSDSAIAALGLSGSPARAPWSMVGVLPDGPRLDRDAASVSRDVFIAAP